MPKFTRKEFKAAKLNIDLLKEAAIPRKFWDLSVDTYFGSRSALLQVRRYAEKFKIALENNVGLFIHGPPQSFKTFLGSYAAKVVLLGGNTVDFASVDHLTETYFERDGIGGSFIARCCRSELLVLDNANTPLNKGALNVVVKAVGSRFDEGLPTCICSLLEVEEIEEIYGVRLSAQLAQFVKVDTTDTHMTFRMQEHIEEAVAPLLYKEEVC